MIMVIVMMVLAIVKMGILVQIVCMKLVHKIVMEMGNVI